MSDAMQELASQVALSSVEENVKTVNALETEVNGVIAAALNGGGVGAEVRLEFKQQSKRSFRVDYVEVDCAGEEAQVWLSSDREVSWLNRLRRVRVRDLVRVKRSSADIRFGVSKVMVRNNQPIQVRYREEIGTPRQSKRVATVRKVQADSKAWLTQHCRLAG